MSTTERRRSLLDPSPSKWDREVTLSYGEPREEHTYTHFNRDELRGLTRSTRLLEQLLKRSAVEDLPGMTWTVTPSSVSGEISTLGGATPFQRRDAFMAWVAALGAEWREHRPGNGQVELRGSAKVPAPGAAHLKVDVGLAAIWWTTDEAEQSP